MAPACERRRASCRAATRARARGGRRRLTPSHLLEDAIGLPLRVPCGDRLTLVVSGLSARDRDLDLAAPVLEVHAERHQRDALFLRRARQLHDLLVMQEELAPPDGIEVAA